jgi:hypothetical protein
MNSRVTLLGGLLVAQLLLLLLMNLNARAPEPGGGLVDVDPSAVTSLRVTDAEASTVMLHKSADQWLLESGARADADKINSVIERLAEMASLWPVAATSSSQSRFEVADDNFQRLLELNGSGTGARIYLGTSPGYRRVHARNGDSDDVFSIEFANHEVPADASEWLDQTQLQVAAITEFSLQDGWTLSEAGDDWLIDGEVADADAARALIDQVEQLRVLGLFSGDETTLEATRVLEVSAGGEDYTMTLRRDPVADEYVVTSSRAPGSFTVASYVAEQILVTAQTLRESDLSSETATEDSVTIDQPVEGDS